MGGSLVLRRVAVSLVVVILLLGVGLAASFKLASMRKPPGRQEAGTRAIAVRVERMARTSFQEQLVGYGRARALRTTQVAAEVSGTVRWQSPRLEAGTALEAGEELVRIDDRDLKEALASAVARLAKSRAERKRLEAERTTQRRILEIAEEELEASRRELERLKDLEGRQASTKSDIDRQLLQVTMRRTARRRLEGQISSLDAQIERAAAETLDLEAAVREAQVALERTVIRAPYAGRCEQRLVELGARVAPGTVLFELVDLSRIEIPVALAASRYGDVRVGARASVRLGDNLAWEGTVTRVAPAVNVEDRTFFVYLVLENPATSSPVPPGAFVSARIEGRRFDNVFVLPRTAFVGDEIFTVDGDVARACRPKISFSLSHVLLADGGLRDGDEVILTNLEEIADGVRILPIRKTVRGEGS